jgi:hypothetical protein
MGSLVFKSNCDQAPWQQIVPTAAAPFVPFCITSILQGISYIFTYLTQLTFNLEIFFDYFFAYLELRLSQ